MCTDESNSLCRNRFLLRTILMCRRLHCLLKNDNTTYFLNFSASVYLKDHVSVSY